ncbi:MAG: hypothetical protein L0Y71_10890 [Gemmataceae bacterium]|nr:hypothetical protein [Gemmataceae bacterium]
MPTAFWDNGGGDGLWENPLNWSDDTLPGGGDGVVINNGYNIVNNLANTTIYGNSIRTVCSGNGQP